MTTARDIVNFAYKDAGLLGLGQTLSGENASNGLTRLNRMIAQWRRRRTLIFATQNVSKVSTGAVSYTVGTGGDFSTTRPDKLEDGCFVRLNPIGTQPTDYPLRIIQAREDYNKIVLKSMQSQPAYVFYDSAFPMASAFIYPVPTATIYEIFLMVKTQLAAFATLDTAFNAPEEYEQAMQQNLAVLLRKGFRLPDDMVLMRLAEASLNTIRNVNAQIQSMRMPADLTRPGYYNYLSDTVY